MPRSLGLNKRAVEMLLEYSTVLGGFLTSWAGSWLDDKSARPLKTQVHHSSIGYFILRSLLDSVIGLEFHNLG
jgi:hypothetical protein